MNYFKNRAGFTFTFAIIIIYLFSALDRNLVRMKQSYYTIDNEKTSIISISGSFALNPNATMHYIIYFKILSYSLLIYITEEMTLLFWLGIGLPLVVIVILIVAIVVVYMKKRRATQVPAVDNDSESQSRYTRFKAWRAHYYI